MQNTISNLNESSIVDSRSKGVPVGLTEDLCAQCGLRNPPRLRCEWDGQAFCCQGCRTAFRIVQSSGLAEALERGELPLKGGARADPTGNRYLEYDDPVFICESACEEEDGLKSIELLLEGVHCASCVRLIEKLPRWIGGLIETRLNLRGSSIHLRWNEAQIKLSQIATILDSLGYPTHPKRGRTRQEHEQRLERRQLLQLAIAGALAGNAMLVAIALYAGSFEGMAIAHETLFRWVSLALGTTSLLGPGRTFFRGAWSAIRTRSSHMDLPIALGLGAGGIAGIVNTIRGTGEIYFDSLTVLVFLLLVGRWLQSNQQRRAADSIELLFSLTPRRARRLIKGAVEVVPVEAIREGDTVEVLAGELIPVDGDIWSGQTSLDTSLLTGESIPIEAVVGDRVAAGVTNQSSRIEVKVTATGSDTRVGKLMALVENATANRAPVVQIADRIAGWFVLVVLLLAFCTWLTWTLVGSSDALSHAISLLIVACPCALGLATPLTLAMTLGRAARQRILIRSSDVIEGLASKGALYLDKTGTCTQGKLRVLNWCGDDAFIEDVVALQRHSSHPIAKAMVEQLGVDRDVREGTTAGTTPRVNDVKQHARGGISGQVGSRRIVIGNSRTVSELGVTITEDQKKRLNQEARQGRSPVLVAIDGSVRVIASVGDPIREDAHDAIQKLQAKGWKVGMLSGDHPEVVQHVARQLGIDSSLAIGALAPEEKLEIINRNKERGPVIMVGDGVNDAAALAAATVGIAVKNGAETSLEAAPVYIARDGLRPLVALVEASRKSINTVRSAIALSLTYNVAAVTLAALGLITPLVAAVLMPISSLTVVFVAVASPSFRRQP